MLGVLTGRPIALADLFGASFNINRLDKASLPARVLGRRQHITGARRLLIPVFSTSNQEFVPSDGMGTLIPIAEGTCLRWISSIRRITERSYAE